MYCMTPNCLIITINCIKFQRDYCVMAQLSVNSVKCILKADWLIPVTCFSNPLIIIYCFQISEYKTLNITVNGFIFSEKELFELNPKPQEWYSLTWMTEEQKNCTTEDHWPSFKASSLNLLLSIIWIFFISFCNSFIWSKSFILVRVALDPGSIPGSVGVRWEYNLIGTGHGPLTQAHIHSHIGAVEFYFSWYWIKTKQFITISHLIFEAASKRLKHV